MMLHCSYYYVHYVLLSLGGAVLARGRCRLTLETWAAADLWRVAAPVCAYVD